MLLLSLCLGLWTIPAGAAPEVEVLPLPKSVARILDDHCVQCHDSSRSQEFGGLDLGHWIELPDGGWGFPHENAKRELRPLRYTLTKMRETLTDPNPDDRMPLGDTLKPAELKTLLDWISEFD